jgi:prepilin-type N-terminal cleavage/methylation domain-containing protein/prepilin-type processing-associated H-X9-DG protein
MTKAQRSGFTLMELLVVCALMALLAAILFPVFARVRARARQSLCTAHLHQIAQAGLMYLQDHDERFPSCYRAPAPPYFVDLPLLLQPYVKHCALFYCPERLTVRAECRDPVNGFRPHARCLGYGYNWGSGLGWGRGYRKGDGLVRPGEEDPSAVVGVTLAEVQQPERCLFLGDTNDFSFLTLLRDVMPGAPKSTDPIAVLLGAGGKPEPPRHQGGNLFAFVDGHVEWLRYPGGRWIDGGPWVVPEMAMYSRTGEWEPARVP